MEISIISFTGAGEALAQQLQRVLDGDEVQLFHKPQEGVCAWAGRQFAGRRALVFIGACGIAVRAIAPFVKDKLTDSPVVVADEAGRFVIPILSGHVGGANRLAEQIAAGIGAEAVITTATDIRNRFAVDVFAKQNGFSIENREGIARVSAKVLRGERIAVSIADYEQRLNPESGEKPDEVELIAYPPTEQADVIISTTKPGAGQEAALWLKPQCYLLGIGCKKGKSAEELSALIEKHFKHLGLTRRDIAAVASIARKKDEPGICAWAREHNVPFVTFSEAELCAVTGSISRSEFVRQTVGVDNVCERAALAACGRGGELVLKKQAENGMTLAVAKRAWQVTW